MTVKSIEGGEWAMVTSIGCKEWVQESPAGSCPGGPVSIDVRELEWPNIYLMDP